MLKKVKEVPGSSSLLIKSTPTVNGLFLGHENTITLDGHQPNFVITQVHTNRLKCLCQLLLLIPQNKKSYNTFGWTETEKQSQLLGGFVFIQSSLLLRADSGSTSAHSTASSQVTLYTTGAKGRLSCTWAHQPLPKAFNYGFPLAPQADIIRQDCH